MELTKAFLQQLPDAETRRREQRLVAQYVAAIRGHVLQRARERHTVASFWIVDPVLAALYLTATAPLFYPWHHKYIRRFQSPYASAYLRRPLPKQLLLPILDEVRAGMPDCDVRIITRTIALPEAPDQGENQTFLAIDWS